MGRANIVRNRVIELRNNIALCRKYKQELIDFLQKQKDLILKRELTQQQYKEIISKRRDGKTIPEWIEHYNWYELECKKRIELEKRQQKSSKAVSALTISLSLILFSVFSFYLFPALIGFATKEKAQLYEDSLLLPFDESGEYVWAPQNKGSLNSAGISGFIDASANVKVYLDDLLIFDSTKLEKKPQENENKGSSISLLTGLVISDSESTETTSEDSSSVESSDSSSTEETSSSEKSPDVTDNVNPSENNVQKEASQTENSPSQEKPLLENNTEPEGSSENATSPEEENTAEKIKRISFSEICLETCDLSALNLTKESYKIKVEISSTEDEEKKNDVKLFINRITYSTNPISSEPGNETPPEIANITQGNVSLQNQSEFQFPAEINKPVRWKKFINANEINTFSVTIPYESENISLNDAKEGKNINFKEKNDSGRLVEFENEKENSEYELSYETPAPLISEVEENQFKKTIKVSGPDSIHYENVLTYASISEIVSVTNPEKIKLFWIINGTKQEHPFNFSDTDNNSLIDKITWITPHLSNETFEIIIITKAQHLNKDRQFISDIYDSVKSLDEVWSEEIPNNDYVRVTFEKNLTKSNDITIFPKTISGNPKIKVYEYNKTELIAEFTSLNDNTYNKILLTNLKNTQDTFDLEIINGAVSFDHIIDPHATGLLTLYLNNTASGGACPTSSRGLGTNAPSSTVLLYSGEFDSGFPGTTDAGQWHPGITLTNTTSSTEINDTAQTSRTPVSFGRGWLYSANLTGYRIGAGNYSFNLTLTGGQGANTLTERIMARISVVTCNGTAFSLVEDLTPTNIVGEGSHSNGQVGWRSNEDTAIAHPGVNANVNFKRNISATGHTFVEGEMLFVELGFGDADTTGDRTSILNYNIPASYVVTPTITDALTPLTQYVAPTESNNSFLTRNYALINVTSTDENLRNITISLMNSTLAVLNSSVTGSSPNFINFSNLADGVYYFNASSNDTSGNTNKTAIRTITIDRTNPVVSLIAPINNTTVPTSSVSFNATFTDNINLANTTFYLWNSTGAIINQTTSSLSSTAAGTNLTVTLPRGERYFWNYYTCDSASNCISNSTNFTIFYSGNAAPTIIFVSSLADQSITENTINNVLVTFIASDIDGTSNLNVNSAIINFTRPGEAVRQNTTCSKIADLSATTSNFSCIVHMWYFDSAGTWNISVSVNDSSNAVGYNSTNNFTLLQTAAFVSSPGALSWDALSPGQTNQSSSNDPLLLNNTGNKPITDGNVQINATHLKGETDSTKGIYAENFTVSIVNGGSPALECGLSTNQTVTMVRSLFTEIRNATLPKGNNSVNDGSTGQEQLYVCMRIIGQEISAQSYSTLNDGAWTIKILMALLAVKGLRKVKKKAKNDRLLKAISILFEEMKEKHSLNTSETITLIADELKEKYNLGEKDIANLIEQREIYIPISIFSNDLGALESICKYLKENKNMKYSEIAKLIGRDQRTVWTSYNKAREKQKEAIEVKETSLMLPLTKILNKNLTILESVIIYCKENKNMKYSEIAKLIGRDQRNIRIAHLNAMKKSREIFKKSNALKKQE